jgi:hypothetical protein
MQFRVFAMYQQSWKIVLFLAACFTAEVTITSIILVISFKKMDGACDSPLLHISVQV